MMRIAVACISGETARRFFGCGDAVSMATPSPPSPTSFHLKMNAKNENIYLFLVPCSFLIVRDTRRTNSPSVTLENLILCDALAEGWLENLLPARIIHSSSVILSVRFDILEE